MAAGHLAQGLDRHLAVNLRGGGARMADVIANGLQGPSGVREALHARVAERVRPQSRHDDAGVVQIVRGTRRDRSLCDGPARRVT